MDPSQNGSQPKEFDIRLQEFNLFHLSCVCHGQKIIYQVWSSHHHRDSLQGVYWGNDHPGPREYHPFVDDFDHGCEENPVQESDACKFRSTSVNSNTATLAEVPGRCMICMSSPHLSTQRKPKKRLRTLQCGQVAAVSCRSRYLQPPPVNQPELVRLTPRVTSEASLEMKSPSLPIASVARNGHPVQFGC